MKYAIVDGIKAEATKGKNGKCPSCGAELTPKCGEFKINHWAHKGKRTCDPWWENETDWHRSWKGNFPSEWQEIVHFDKDGEKHIADVKTSSGWVLEFQHSYLEHAERKARNNFYGKIVWVVDGTRRKTDKQQFMEWLSRATQSFPKFPIFRATFPSECRLLREWQDDSAIIFLDFNDLVADGDANLWLVFPKLATEVAYVAWFSKRRLVELHNNGQFDDFVQNIFAEFVKIIREMQSQPSNMNNRPRFMTAAERRLRARPRRRL